MTAPSTGDPLNSPRFGRELLAFVTGSLLRVAEQAGLDGNDLLASAGLSREQLKSPDAYLPVEKHIALGMRMTEMLGSVNAGLHSGAAIYGDPSGALGFAIRRSRNHATALTRFCRFMAVTNESVIPTTIAHDGKIEFAATMLPEMARLGHPTEALFSAWVSIARYATGVRWAPLSVKFAHSALGPTDEHTAFFEAPVHFDADTSSMLISAHCASLAIEPAPHPLEEVFQRVEGELRERASRGSLDAVVELISALRHGRLEHVDECEHALRVQAARALLSHKPSLAAFEVAFLLGFAGVRELLANVNS